MFPNVVPAPESQVPKQPPYRHETIVPPEESLQRFPILAKGRSAVLCFSPPSVTQLYVFLVLAMRLPLTLVVEKSWFTCLVVGRAIEQLLRSAPTQVRFADHYLHKSVIRWLLAQDLPHFIGRVNRIEARLYEPPGPVTPPMAMGVLADLAIHLISIVIKLCPGGKTVVDSAFAAQAQSWDFASESFVSVGGRVETDGRHISFHVEAAKESPVTEKVIVLTGTHGCLRIDIARETATLQQNGAPSRTVFPETDSSAPTERPYDHILRCLALGHVEQVGLDIHEALHVWNIIEAARQLFPSTLVRYSQRV
jgi:hypothetical protein